MRRILATLGATLLASGIVASVDSQPASATSSVTCYADNTGNPVGPWWFDCDSSNGTQTTWYFNGVYHPEWDGASSSGWDCLYGRRYTIGVNLGTALAATWTGYCDDRR